MRREGRGDEEGEGFGQGCVASPPQLPPKPFVLPAGFFTTDPSGRLSEVCPNPTHFSKLQVQCINCNTAFLA